MGVVVVAVLVFVGAALVGSAELTTHPGALPSSFPSRGHAGLPPHPAHPALPTPNSTVFVVFSYSRSLTTGTTYANGHTDCGNKTGFQVSYPANTTLHEWAFENQTNETVLLWEDHDTNHLFINLGGMGWYNGTEWLGTTPVVIDYSTQGCAPTQTVSLTLYGYYTT
jgi:hypothetical protein